MGFSYRTVSSPPWNKITCSRSRNYSAPSFDAPTLYRPFDGPVLVRDAALSTPLVISRKATTDFYFVDRSAEFLRREYDSVIIREYVLKDCSKAPVAEELVFRACLVAVADLSGKGAYYKIFVTPFWFGIGASQLVPRQPHIQCQSRYSAPASCICTLQ